MKTTIETGVNIYSDPKAGGFAPMNPAGQAQSVFTPDNDPSLSVSGVDLAGKVVYVPGYADPLKLFRCSGGFGCDPTKAGSAVFGKWLANGDSDRIERGSVRRLASTAEIEAGHDYAKLSPAIRFEKSLAAFWELVDRKIETPGKTKEDLKNSLYVIHREFDRLRHYVTTPAEDGGSAAISVITANFAEAWDKRNKERH